MEFGKRQVDRGSPDWFTSSTPRASTLTVSCLPVLSTEGAQP
jgi:hypothetical protein